ncbi:MAG TPA: copper chaperone PCu(A)C [Gemmatimonadaceae bacterium]|nr:copper chaperone PCu(A)C [Gemmatimonadaceae bacterium]
MKRRIGIALAAAAAALGGCRVVPVDQTGTVGWTRGYLVKPAAGSPAALYLWITNPTAHGDTATAVRLAAADSAQIHRTMAMGNGMEHMTPVVALPIPAHDTARFAPGGLHVMVFGLDSALARGDSAQVTVTFARAGDVTGWAHVITYADVDSLLLR